MNTPAPGLIGIAITQRGDAEYLDRLLCEAGYWSVRQIALESDLDGCDLIVLDLAGARRWQAAVESWRNREAPRLAPVLVLSERRDVDELADGGLWQIADDLLCKPLSRRELFSRVAVALRARQLSRRLESHYTERLEIEAERYRVLTGLASDAAYCGVVTSSREGKTEVRVDWVNDGLRRYTRQDTEAFSLAGGLSRWVVDEDRALLDVQYQATLRGRRSRELLRLELPDGRVTMEHQVLPQTRGTAKRCTLLAVMRNVTSQQRQAELGIPLTRVVEQHPECMLIASPGGRILYLNAALRTQTAWNPQDDRDDVNLDEVTHRLGLPSLRAQLEACLSGEHEVSHIESVPEREGRPARWWRLRWQTLLDAGGQAEQVVCSMVDVTNAREQEALLQYLSTHDPLTDLPAREALHAELSAALDWRRPGQEEIAVMLLAITNLQSINESGGHEAGDTVLRTVSARVKTLSDPLGAKLGRMGGNEFAYIQAFQGSVNDIARQAESILHALDEPILTGNDTWPLVAHIGIAVSPEDGEDPSELFKKAESALNACRANGGGHYLFFRTGMNTRAIERLRLEADMRQAILGGELLLYYQPKIAIAPHGVAEFEALLRCRHPTRGLLSPAEFIPVLEASGLILAAGRQVVTMACEQWLAWREQGFDTRIAVNVSPCQLEDPGFCEDVLGLISHAGVPPGRVEFEITESVVMHNPELKLPVLAKLREAGCRIALDDFGTGYSSLAYLARLPVDVLKIDQSFVAPLPEDVRLNELVRGIISFSHALGLTVVAEGVETAAQAQTLADMGCDVQQGFLHARPLPKEEASEYLRQHHAIM